MTFIKAELVDHSLINYPKIKPRDIQIKIANQDNSKLYLNFFMLCILGIGGYTLYYRMSNKVKEKEELDRKILSLDKYVSESIGYLNSDSKDNKVIE